MEVEWMTPNSLSIREVAFLMDGAIEIGLHFNDPMALESAVVIVMLVHDNGPEISHAVDSVLSQTGAVDYALLMVSSQSPAQALKHIGSHRYSPNLILAHTPITSVAQGRNLSRHIVKECMSSAEWICRLDADDELAHNRVLSDIHGTLSQAPQSIRWALAGNTLTQDGEVLERVNHADDSLLGRELIKRLERMANADSTAELPSCNLWLRPGFKAVYPDIGSGEDHWLVTHLLVNHSEEGILLKDSVHANYNLSGGTTEYNKDSGIHQRSRQLLFDSVRFWNDQMEPVSEVCLGWGSEGNVWRIGESIEKRFHSLVLKDEDVDWLKSLPPGPMPSAAWIKGARGWVAESVFEETEPAISVSREQISRFIEYCLESQIVFLNISRANLRLRDGDLFCLDIGSQIVPYEDRYFRDMCLRLYLVFIEGWSDQELSERSLKFRNNVEAMRSVDGFEQFYHREILKYFYHRGAFRKPSRDIQPKARAHDEVTLMVKSCAMEADLIERQSHHIMDQVCRYDSFNERILLLDPKEGVFLRQYNEGNIASLLEVASRLEREGVYDRVLISPLKGAQQTIGDLHERWFGLRSEQTHTTEGVPVFPQLWGFEQVTTRYLLQMDADVLIARSEDDDVFSKMLEALLDEAVFGVGFNIPQDDGAEFKPYDGDHVPEVRCGLFDLNRMLKERPFPNSLQDGHLESSWYRSIERYQTDSEWRCLRGGDPSSVYIHPPNILKSDLGYYDRAMDLVEQGRIPTEQRGKWDLIENEDAWQYPKRPEELIFMCVLSNPSSHWSRALLESLMLQTDKRWGAVIFDDGSSPGGQKWLLELISQMDERITLIRRRFGPADEIFVNDCLHEVCTHENPMIISLEEKDVLFDGSVVSNIHRQIESEHSDLSIPVYLARYPLGLEANHLRHQVNRYGIVNDSRGRRLHSNGSGAILELDRYALYNGDMSADIYDERPLRATTYIPNLRKLEIDITYFCNLTCAGCSRSSAQAPSGQHMSVDTVIQFLRESEERGIIWESLHILGGEPTLHPDFIEIVTILDDWFMENSPETDLKVITNGVSKKVQNNIMSIPERWRYDNSFKHDRELDTSHFEPFNLAPIDLPEWRGEDFTKGCYITQDSGIGLTPYGYFHCAIAGGIERIINLGHGFETMPDHPWQFLEMMKDYCRFCGHFLSDAFMERSERIDMEISPETVSESWERAYDEWRVKGDA